MTGGPVAGATDVTAIEAWSVRCPLRHHGNMSALPRCSVLLMTLALIAAPGCRSAPGALTAAAVWTTAAALSSAGSRALGGCYSACVQGTFCNPRTGLCERLPCGGQCRADERCEQRGRTERCVSKYSPPLRLQGSSRTETSTAAE